MGFAPVALGCDGGGSVRTPSAMSGVFGFKPTYGRIPMSGHGMPWGSSVTHIGPLATHTEDLAAFIEIAAGADPLDPSSQMQPTLVEGELTRSVSRGVRGLKIGIDEAAWTRAGPAQSKLCRAALEVLEHEGAELVPIRLELAPYAPAIGYLTIAIEAVAGMVQERQHMDDLLPETQLLVSVVSAFKADDYVLAQRLRGALRRQLQAAFFDVDLIAQPTLAGPPPRVSDAEEAAGFVDPEALAQASAYCYLGNLCGSPSGTAPVGFDDGGLPVGLEIVGDAWDEASVLAALAHLERTGAARCQSPEHSQDLMHESAS
jgi:aspartyl-tRNA(Asn)/glutamyl-tRNA(Gln) amidotransferase subunit A